MPLTALPHAESCTACANWIFYPREQCPVCFSQKLAWAPVSGRGRVYTYTIVHQPAHPGFQGEPSCWVEQQLAGAQAGDHDARCAARGHQRDGVSDEADALVR